MKRKRAVKDFPYTQRSEDDASENFGIFELHVRSVERARFLKDHDVISSPKGLTSFLVNFSRRGLHGYQLIINYFNFTKHVPIVHKA